MVVRFLCKCGKNLKAPDEYIGKKVSCSKCGEILRVPDEDQAPKAKKKSKPPVKTYKSQEVSLPPLSEVRKPEEVMAEKSSSPTPEESASSNIAQQMLRPSDPVETEEPLDAGFSKPATKPPAKKSTGHKQFGEQKKSKKKDATTEANKYFVKMVLGGGAGVLIVCYGLYAIMTSMVSTTERPPLESISGIITLDDKPLPRAEVRFIPQDEWKNEKKPSSSFGITDEQGKFELIYSKDAKGAAVGNHIIQIFSQEQKIPIIYNVKTVLKYEVKGSDDNVELKLISK